MYVNIRTRKNNKAYTYTYIHTRIHTQILTPYFVSQGLYIPDKVMKDHGTCICMYTYIRTSVHAYIHA
jgi:hypothetical protein